MKIWEKLKTYLLSIDPYQDFWKVLVAYFLSRLAGKGFSLYVDTADASMQYIILSVAAVLFITSINSVKSINKLMPEGKQYKNYIYLFSGWIILLANIFGAKIISASLMYLIILFTIMSGVLNNLEVFKKVGVIK